MADFDTVKTPEWDMSSRQYFRGLHTDEFEKGYTHSRKTGARGRYMWSLGWSFMTIEEFETLKTFFDTNLGGSFTFTNYLPTTSGGAVYDTYTVKFMDGELPEETPVSNHGVSLKGLTIVEI
jgi:hypothetical protein